MFISRKIETQILFYAYYTAPTLQMSSSSRTKCVSGNGKSKIIFDSCIDIVKIITEQKRQKIDSDRVSESDVSYPSRYNQQLSNQHGKERERRQGI